MSSQTPFVKPDDHRKKWSHDEYERLAKSRIEAEQKKLKEHEKPKEVVKRELLRPREYEVDLDSKLGRTCVITKGTPSGQQGGYYCNVCDCVVKDSINFLDHINGKKHQRNLGMSMRVEKSSLDQVKARFEHNKKRQEEKMKEYNFDERMKELKEEEAKHKAYKKDKRDRKRKATDSFTDLTDPDMASMMGFAGFK